MNEKDILETENTSETVDYTPILEEILTELKTINEREEERDLASQNQAELLKKEEEELAKIQASEKADALATSEATTETLVKIQENTTAISEIQAVSIISLGLIVGLLCAVIFSRYFKIGG